jgi:hypothetical protein
MHIIMNVSFVSFVLYKLDFNIYICLFAVGNYWFFYFQNLEWYDWK